MNTKALSPLTATLLLVVFAIIVGALTMAWGKSYIEVEEDEQSSVLVISFEDLDTPLKQLMADHITGRISEEEFKEKSEES